MRTFLIIFPLYLAGALVMLRHQILSVQNDIDEHQDCYDKSSKKKRDEVRWRLGWDEEDYYQVGLHTFFWYAFVAYGIFKFLMFPRGIKSKFAREQEKKAKAKENEARAAKAEEDLRKMQDEVLKFMPHETAAASYARLRCVVEGQRPDDGDDDLRVAS